MYSENASNKHFHILPKPIFEYLCSLDITRAQQNIFVLLYGESHINGTPFTKIATKTISKRLCISMSTVKRAYKALSNVGLIARHDQGRCRFNPMRSAITKTEILIPEELRKRLQQTPDRDMATKAMAPSESNQKESQKEVNNKSKKKRKSYIALHDESDDLASTTATDKNESVVSVVNDALGLTRNISLHYAVKIRELLKTLVDNRRLQQVCNEVLWSLENGVLAAYPLTKGRNIALKLIRQNRWTSPKDMPTHWQWSQA